MESGVAIGFNQKCMRDFCIRRSFDDTFRGLVKTAEVLNLINRISCVFSSCARKNAPKKLVNDMRKILGGTGSVRVTIVVSTAEPDLIEVEKAFGKPVPNGELFEYVHSMKMQISGLVYRYLAVAPIEDIRELLSSRVLRVIITPREGLNSFLEVRFPLLCT